MKHQNTIRVIKHHQNPTISIISSISTISNSPNLSNSSTINITNNINITKHHPTQSNKLNAKKVLKVFNIFFQVLSKLVTLKLIYAGQLLVLFKSLNLSQKEMMWWFSNIWVLQINQVMNDHVNIETNGSEVYTLISRNPMYFLAFFINLWRKPC